MINKMRFFFLELELLLKWLHVCIIVKLSGVVSLNNLYDTLFPPSGISFTNIHKGMVFLYILTTNPAYFAHP